MLAEFEYVQGRRARWWFALGCVQVALFSPPKPARSIRLLRTIVMVGVAGTALTALYASTQTPERSISLDATKWVVLVVALLAYTSVTYVVTRANTPKRLVAYRLGLAGGLGVGTLMLLVNSPASPFGNLNMDIDPRHGGLAGVSPLLVSLGIAAVAARRSRDIRTGVQAGLCTGMVACLMFCVGLMGLTYGATDWFTNDPATTASWMVNSFFLMSPAEHQQQHMEVAAYLIRANAGPGSVPAPWPRTQHHGWTAWRTPWLDLSRSRRASR